MHNSIKVDTAVRSRNMTVEGCARTLVLERRFFINIGTLLWENLVSNSEFRCKALDPRVQPLEKPLYLNKPKWLMYVQRGWWCFIM